MKTMTMKSVAYLAASFALIFICHGGSTLANAQSLRHRQLATGVSASSPDFEFTPDLLDVSRMAAYLSVRAYGKEPVTSITNTNFSSLFHSIQEFHNEPDQALVASTVDNRYCFAAFRGTLAWIPGDFYQNVKTGVDSVCHNISGSGACCDVNRGFNEGFTTSYRPALEAALRKCATTCGSNNNNSTGGGSEEGTSTATCPTVVLTGHSQGGSIALAASLHLLDLNATIITFGQLRTVRANCTLISSDRVYRFENSRSGAGRGLLTRLRSTVTYDPFPYMADGATHYGHQIMLGDDASAVAYLGHNTETTFRPWSVRDVVVTHSMDSSLINGVGPDDVGYLPRLEALAKAAGWNVTADLVGPRDTTTNNGTSTLRIVSTGFREGAACTRDVECQSNRCSAFRRKCVAG